MNHIRKVSAVLLMLLIAGMAFATGSNEGRGDKILVCKIGSATSPLEPLSKAGDYLCKTVNERLAGKVEFQYYDSEKLGKEKSMMEGLQTGLIQGMTNSFDSYAVYARDLSIMTMAFTFRSHEHLYKYLASDLGKTAYKKLEEVGFHIVNNSFQKNPRAIWAKKPIVTPADLAGVKFRIPDLPIFEKNVRQMGAIPTVVAWSEYPYALMQGVVDAGEGTYENIVSKEFYKSCPYISLVDYAYPLECFSMAVTTWNVLTAAEKKIIEKTAAEAAELYNKILAESWGKDKQTILNAGGKFVEFNKKAFMDQMAPLADRLESEKFWDTPGLYAKIQAIK
jgi:TRAP-type C4-dicarboxylate transport system substrate-binding protein